MSWHNFAEGVDYDVEEIISVLEQRLASGEVEDVAGKRENLNAMKCRIGESVFFMPESVAYGRSPFNLNVWKDKDGNLFFG